MLAHVSTTVIPEVDTSLKILKKMQLVTAQNVLEVRDSGDWVGAHPLCPQLEVTPHDMSCLGRVGSCAWQWSDMGWGCAWNRFKS